MNELQLPITRKLSVLYQTASSYRPTIPKQDRHTIWLRVENLLLDIFQAVILASQRSRAAKRPILEEVSAQLTLLRILVRLAKDSRAIDEKKYLALEQLIDEIGRMLGGWLRSIEAPPIGS